MSLAWPAVLHADDGKQEAQAENENEVPPGAYQFGDVAAATEIQTDAKTGKALLHLVAVNTSKREAFVKLELCLEKYEINPMARSGPPPETAWEQTAKLVVPAGDRYERTYLLPRKLAKEIIAAQKVQQDAAKDETQTGELRVYSSYQASVRAPEPDQAAG